MAIHTSHPDIIKRRKRAEGHIRSVIKSMEEQKPCLELAQQLQAVENAICNAKKLLIHDHIDHCIEHAVREGTGNANQTIREFKAITKYL